VLDRKDLRERRSNPQLDASHNFELARFERDSEGRPASKILGINTDLVKNSRLYLVRREVAQRSSDLAWRRRTFELSGDTVILMRDTGMRNQHELYRMRIENLDWQSRVVFVPDSKTADGRRPVPMSRRVSLLSPACRRRIASLSKVAA
jgi:integrase